MTGKQERVHRLDSVSEPYDGGTAHTQSGDELDVGQGGDLNGGPDVVFIRCSAEVLLLIPQEARNLAHALIRNARKAEGKGI